jgi:simple sugar transport system permease protein
MMSRLRIFFINNAVAILILLLIACALPVAKLPAKFLAQEILMRMGRDTFLVLALLLPIMAGMGLNFGMVLGAMAGQLGLMFITDWGIVGIPGLLLAMIISLPISIVLGWLCGAIMNKATGREMVTGFILAFFMNGLYMLVVLYAMGSLIPIFNPEMLLSRGYGIRNVVGLDGVRQAFDNLIPLKIAGLKIPVFSFVIIALGALFLVWFRKTRLGQNMRAVGQDRGVAAAAGIPVERTRILAIIISTVLAGFGQIIFLQNLGTINTTSSHEQIGMFSIAALLIGGASVTKASIPNVIFGVILFHLMFLVSPMAGKNLIGSGMLGEYFRQFVSYGVIALALVLYEWKRVTQENEARAGLRNEAGTAATSAAKPAGGGAA